MKLKRLKIQNLASIQGAEIDFTAPPLSEAPLFLICGDTGAGKTTILDAICLALYGKTPRYHENAREATVVNGLDFDDPRQLVRRGSSAAAVTLEFQGNDLRDYCAKWSVDLISRGVNKGELKNTEWSLKALGGSGETYSKVHDIVLKCNEVVGLDFEQFCRTTMLAQGQFTRFLLADDADKAAILEKLTSTERFSELGRKIAEKYSQASGEVKVLEARLESLGGMGVEERERLEQERMVLQEAEKSGQAQVEGLARRLEWRKGEAEQEGNLQAALERCRKSREALQGQEFLLAQRDVSQWDAARESLGQYRLELASAAEIAEVRRKLARSRLRYGELKGGVEWLLEEHARRCGELEKKEEWLAAEAPLAPMYEDSGVIVEKLSAARGFARKAEESAARKLAIDRALPGMEAGLEKLGQAVAKAEEKLRASQAELAEAELALERMDIQGVRARGRACQARRDSLVAARNDIQSLLERRKERDALKESLEASERRLQSCQGRRKELEEALRKSGEESEEAGKRYQKTRELIDDGLGKILSSLSVGEKCPVCGATISHLEQESEIRKMLKPLREEWERRKGASARAEEAFGALLATVGVLEKAREQDRKALQGKEQLIEALEGGLEKKTAALGPGEFRVEVLEGRIGECDEKLRGIKEIDDSYVALQSRAGALNKEKEKRNRALADSQEALSKARNAWKEAKAEGERLEKAASENRMEAEARRKEASALVLGEEWQRRFAEENEDFGKCLQSAKRDYAMRKSDWERERRTLEQSGAEQGRVVHACEALEARHGELKGVAAVGKSQMEGLSEQVTALGARYDAEWNELRRAEAEQQSAREAVDGFCAGHPEIPRERLAELASLDIPVRRRTVEAIRGRAAADEGALETVRQQNAAHLARRPGDFGEGDTVEALRSALEQAEEEKKERALRLGVIKGAFETEAGKAEERRRLEEAKEEKQKCKEEWKRLNELFGTKDGKYLRMVIQSYVLKCVLGKANAYLRQLTSRYTLCCRNLTLTVYDDYEGGLERPVNTLSGGESFLISLALALGLAAMNEKGLAVDMLFIDEGFGTLSGEHLGQVMEALEQLNAVGGIRKVGIISHVAGLRDRIRTHIEVCRAGHEPSTVRVTDNGR